MLSSGLSRVNHTRVVQVSYSHCSYHTTIAYLCALCDASRVAVVTIRVCQYSHRRSVRLSHDEFRGGTRGGILFRAPELSRPPPCSGNVAQLPQIPTRHGLLERVNSISTSVLRISSHSARIVQCFRQTHTVAL